MEPFAMHRAAENGDLEQVKHLIDVGQPINRFDSCGRTPVYWAAMCGHLEVVEYLLLNNCNCNKKAYNGTTAVLLAAERGHKEMVDLFLQFGAVVDGCDEFGKWTVLHHASRRGWTETVQYIVENRKLDLNAKTCLGATPLILAADEGHAAIAKLLIQAGANVNICDVDSWSALHYASKRGWLPIVKNLVETTECDVHAKNASGNTPLHIAYGMNNSEIIQELLKAGADSNYRNHAKNTAFFGFPMHLAAENGDLNKLKHLMKLGMSVDIQDDDYGRTPLHWAARAGHFEVAECLLKSSCNMNLICGTDRSIPIELAALYEHKDVFNLLYRRGAFMGPDIDLFNLVAGNAGWLDVVKRIVEDGQGSVNDVCPVVGKTPLMAAAESGNEEIVRYFIEAGADVTRKDIHKQDVLHVAAESGSVEVVKVLLETGKFDVNCKDKQGNTPLHHAFRPGAADVVTMLLTAEADINIKNDDNDTPLSIGLEQSQFTPNEIEFFLQHGAFFDERIYMQISKDPHLKDKVLKNADLCTQSIVNKFNKLSLPALYNNPHFAKNLPNLDKFLLTDEQTEEIKDCVLSEIETHTYCNVVKARPMVLTMMCVQSLLSYQTTTKRARPISSQDHLPMKKSRTN